MNAGKLKAIPIAKVGTWDASTGTVTITRADLAAAVVAYHPPGIRKPILKIGHEDPRFDGEPALGTVTNLRLTDKGNTLVADFEGVPEWLEATMPDRYPDRSLEGVFGMEDINGTEHRLAITAVALLGVTPPAITTLETLREVLDKQPVAAKQQQGHITIKPTRWVR